MKEETIGQKSDVTCLKSYRVADIWFCQAFHYPTNIMFTVLIGWLLFLPLPLYTVLGCSLCLSMYILPTLQGLAQIMLSMYHFLIMSLFANLFPLNS